jgi:cytochrome c oxidase assembly protein subunit 15
MVSSGLVNRVDVSHYRLALHLVLAFLILSLIFWNYLNYKEIQLPSKKINSFLPFSFVVLLFLQLIIGAFVSGMDAGKIYNTWPFMGNNYFPDDNSIVNLFYLSALNDPSLVQFIHRNLAYLIMFFYLFILFRIYSNKISYFYKILKIVGFLLILQILLGVMTLLSGAQMFVSSMHQISSIFLISSGVYFLYLNTKTS